MLRGAAGILPLFIFLLVALPVLKVLAEVAVPSLETWRSLGPLLPLMLRNTLLLLLGVGAGSFLLGVSLAWLTAAYRFPGSRYFEVLLILPLAVPTYVLGYVYMATFDYAGPFSTAARQLLGITLPEIRSGYGAVAVMSLVLYPYVYVMARAGFRQLSRASMDVCRVMGYTGLETLIKVALPLSRPAVAAGMALVMMEALTDFATVRFFNFPTLSEGIIRVWYGRMNLQAAMELAGLLLLFALVVVSVEHRLRGRAQYFQTGGGMEKKHLRGTRGAAAAFFCTSVLFLAFLLPVLQLTLWALEETSAPSTSLEMYLQLLSRSLSLAVAAALVCVLLATVLAGVLQLGGSRIMRRLAGLSTMGYAVPGAAVGVGALSVLSSFDRWLNSLLEGTLGFTPGLLATGTVLGLIYAYTVKFMTIAYSAVDSSMSRITPSITGAARSLGARPLEVVTRIQAPMAVPGIAAGAVLVFVDVMKELPITLILRPFGYDTLAVWVWQMAAESMWGGAALPALTIVLAGVIPVAYIIRRGV